MPLVETNGLPAFAALRREGIELLNADAAGIERPVLNIGLLNLMPDAALRATDRQFLRLIAAYGDRADLVPHVFTVATEVRGAAAFEHIDNWYTNFPAVRNQGMDALIITGANPRHVSLPDERFWEPLLQVLDWATDNVPSVLCSCLATHAVAQHLFGETRVRLPAKRWGVYDHAIVAPDNPLVAGLHAPVSAPHSHYFDISKERMEAVGIRVLMHDRVAGVHMATASRGTEWVFFQGHPEYDRVSLLKEYQREITRFANGERGYPTPPEHYFPQRSHEALEHYKRLAISAVETGTTVQRLPEQEFLPDLENRWLSPGRRIYRNWLNRVHQAKVR